MVDIIAFFVLGLLFFTLLVMMALGKSREVHVGRYRAGPEGRNRPVPPADDAGHRGSHTRPPDVQPGPE